MQTNEIQTPCGCIILYYLAINANTVWKGSLWNPPHLKLSADKNVHIDWHYTKKKKYCKTTTVGCVQLCSMRLHVINDAFWIIWVSYLPGQWEMTSHHWIWFFSPFYWLELWFASWSSVQLTKQVAVTCAFKWCSGVCMCTHTLNNGTYWKA